MVEMKITAIGAQAVSEEPLLLLFDEHATSGLAEFSVIHENSQAEFALKEGDTISFGEARYTITRVGPTANANLSSIGHATIVFGEVPTEDPIANSLYVTPFDLPKLSVGMTITFS